MKRTNASIIAETAQKLDGKVDFSMIRYDQNLISEEYKEQGWVNDIQYIGKRYGVYFYTSKMKLESSVMGNEKEELPTLVGVDGTLRLFLIK
jgi:hypothetical protein|nr:MAG TPA: protein of unknown function (DUF910) [Caudoviricetes sp.]